MSISESLLPEFDIEMEATRKALERVADDKLEWTPHEKSMPLNRLASHVAEIPGWTMAVLDADELDFDPPGGEPYETVVHGSAAALLEAFDDGVRKARECISATEDPTYHETWKLKHGGRTLFSAPKIGIYRRFVMNHLIHHRGQLTVYLRLTGAPVPQTLGPTADEQTF